MTSHQLENANRDKIREMYNKMYIKDDIKSQKALLFDLGSANMSWLEPSASGFDEDERKRENSRQTEEIIAIYNSLTGDISLGISYVDTHMKKQGNFYPVVFQNLRSHFNKDVHLYIAFRSRLGSAITIEYLGGIDCIPMSNKFDLSLQSAARYRLLVARGRSLFQEIATWSLGCSVAHFSHNFFWPLVCRFYDEGTNTDILDIVALYQKYRELRRNDFTYITHPDKISAIRSLFPHRVHVATGHIKLLRYLSYHTMHYFDNLFNSSQQEATPVLRDPAALPNVY